MSIKTVTNFLFYKFIVNIYVLKFEHHAYQEALKLRELETKQLADIHGKKKAREMAESKFKVKIWKIIRSSEVKKKLVVEISEISGNNFGPFVSNN